MASTNFCFHYFQHLKCATIVKAFKSIPIHLHNCCACTGGSLRAYILKNALNYRLVKWSNIDYSSFPAFFFFSLGESGSGIEISNWNNFLSRICSSPHPSVSQVGKTCVLSENASACMYLLLNSDLVYLVCYIKCFSLYQTIQFLISTKYLRTFYWRRFCFHVPWLPARNVSSWLRIKAICCYTSTAV